MAEREIQEIEVKSVLNRVHGMPFRWSINPYRGCSHGCVFCLSGDTAILMGDGTHRPLAEVRIGDHVYGTERRGAYRRYVPAQVLARWTTSKPAYRVRLEDGTELIASGDHRFLSNRGWKYVIGAEHGRSRRPHLTLNNTLMGTGAFAAPQVKNADYTHGYLCGVIRGDGHLGFYPYTRAGRRHGHQYRFRLAMADDEALVRARHYLLAAGVSTDRFVFLEATLAHRRIEAIRTSAQRHVPAIESLTMWPSIPSREWRAGFLAGIFDAEGSYRDGILRIPNTDAAIIDHLTASLAHFGFRVATESVLKPRGKPVTVIRVLGGLREHLRFFHTTDPAIRRKRTIEGRVLTHASRRRVVAIEPLRITLPMVDITTTTGDFIANGIVSHNCYARKTHGFMNEDGVNDWASKIFVKANAPDVLRRELGRRTWTREMVALGTATDPYQAIEGRYRVTRRILEALRDFRTPVSIITRCPLIIRDLDLLTDLARRAGVTVCVSLATTQPSLARQIEPTVAPPLQRLRTVARLTEAGIRTGVMLAPILPGLTDDPKHLEGVIRAARHHGAHFVGHNVLHLGDVTREAFYGFLRAHHPDLVTLYNRLYPRTYAPRDYQQAITKIVLACKARLGVTRARYIDLPPATEQIRLFDG